MNAIAEPIRTEDLTSEPARRGMGVISAQTLAAWSKLQPTDDDADPKADVMPDMLLDAAESKALSVKAETLAAASRAVTEAEQAHAAARKQAARLGYLKADLAKATADAFVKTAGALETLQELQADIAACTQAADALPVLADRLAEAKREQGAAFGSLRMLARTCMSNVRHRAAAEFERSVDRAVRALAVIDGAMVMDTAHAQTHGHAWAMFVGQTRIAALPEGLRTPACRAVVEQTSTGALLQHHEHAKYTTLSTHARGKLQSQIQTACGIVGLQAVNLL